MITCTSITSQYSTQSPFIFKDQCGNVAVHVEQPIHVHFRDEDNDLQTETVGGKLETGTDEGSSVSEDEGTCRSL